MLAPPESPRTWPLVEPSVRYSCTTGRRRPECGQDLGAEDDVIAAGKRISELEARIRELEGDRDDARRVAEVNLDAADRHLAELVRYREALEEVARALAAAQANADEQWAKAAAEAVTAEVEAERDRYREALEGARDRLGGRLSDNAGGPSFVSDGKDNAGVCHDIWHDLDDALTGGNEDE